MKVPLLDLAAQYASIKDEIDAAIAEVLASQKFILGPQVKALEEAIANYCGCAHAVGVSSGTDALLVSLMAEGIGPGDEVITTAYSFFATAGCIARLGAKPVFADIDPVTYNLNPSNLQKLITKNSRAILPVHLYGQMADMDPIMDIAKRHNLVVIEDAAQAIGAEYSGPVSTTEGTERTEKAMLASGPDSQNLRGLCGSKSVRRAGSIGEYGCFSFFPSKNLGAFGDGGMVVTNDPERAEKLRVLRAHGSKPKYYHKLVGGNFRLDTLQAAIVLAKLNHLDAWTAARQANAARYDRLFEESGLIRSGLIQLPRNVHPQITPIKEDSRVSSPAAKRNLCESVKSVDGGHPPITPIKEDSSGRARNQDPNLWKSVESVDKTPSPSSGGATQSAESAKSADNTPAGSPAETHQFVNLRKSAESVDNTPGCRHIFNQYVVRVPRRDELQSFLKERSVGTEVYYPLPLHLQECFAYLGHKAGDLPESERAASETLALPVYPELSDEQAKYVVSCVQTFYSSRP